MLHPSPLERCSPLQSTMSDSQSGWHTHSPASIIQSPTSVSQRSFASMEEKSMRKRQTQTRGKRYREELESMIDEHLSKDNSSALTPHCAAANRVRMLTTQKIKAISTVPPLHYFRGGPSGLPSSTAVRIGDVVWNRPDPRVLYHVLRPDRRQANAVERGDGRTHLAVFFLEGVLLQFSNTSANSFFQFTPIPSQSSLVAARIKHFYERGFRIVLLDFVPSLHYGSSDHITRCLQTLYRSVDQLLGHVCTLTILLSITSNVASAVGKQSGTMGSGGGATFVSPRPGMWQFFIQHLNHTLQPDRKKSFLVVGCSTDRAIVSQGVPQRDQRCMVTTAQSEFAHCISLPIRDCASFIEGDG